MKILSLIVLVMVMSCSSNNPLRGPSGVKEDILSLVKAIHFQTTRTIDSHWQCSQKARFYYDKLYSLNEDSSSFSDYSREELTGLVELSFASRLALREELKNFNISKKFSVECLKAARDLTRALRYLEDYAIQKLATEKEADDYITLTGEGAHFLKNTKHSFNNFSDLKSGDIILSRGNAFSSAAIARIGTIDAQFSHLTLVYRDDTGELHTIESHIEIGAVAMPFSYHIDEKNTRSVVLRYKDQTLAARAAKHMYEKVKNYTMENKKNIEYDFAMDYKDNKRLFCSEVIYDGFKHASNGSLDIPMYKTKFNPNLLNFLNAIGLNITSSSIYKFDTFGPGDIEFDQRFHLVSEWRNPLKLQESRVRDAILTKLYEWMETKGYNFYPSLETDIKSRAGWILRRLGQYKNDFPLNMNVKQLKLFQVLEEVGDILEAEVLKYGNTHLLSFNQIYDILEDYRLKDLKLYKTNKKKASLHQRFR